MERIKFNYYEWASGVTIRDIENLTQIIEPEINRVKNAIGSEYETKYAAINLSFDKKMLAEVKRLVQKKKEEIKPTVFVVIGIGGSSMGTIAVHEALNGLFYNEFNPKIKIYFANTIQEEYLEKIIALVERELKEGGSVLVNVVSKSGTTTETIVNFEIFLRLMQNYYPQDYAQHFVVTTDRKSKLWGLAQEKNIATLEIPKNIIGRYSVFSPVSLFPLAVVGIDIDQLCAGATSIIEDLSREEEIEKNISALSAMIIYEQFKKGCRIHDTFIFPQELRSLGNWYRQLVAESLGKEFDREGGAAHTGIVPTVSMGPNDLHTVVQLYLAGPRNRFTTFINPLDLNGKLVIPKFDRFEELVAYIQGKPVSFVLNVIKYSLQRSYYKFKRPYVSIDFPKINAFYLGQFLQMKMLEVVYLANFFKVNPFDQPLVEFCKKVVHYVLTNNR